jgi:hypothetical protein
MDPNANLAEQRAIAARIIAEQESSGDAARLADLVDALDGWLSNRGFLPRRWTR